MPQDMNESWLYSALGIPDINTTGFDNMTTFLNDPTLSGAADPSQMVFDVMGEGMRFSDNTFDHTQLQR